MKCEAALLQLPLLRTNIKNCNNLSLLKTVDNILSYAKP